MVSLRGGEVKGEVKGAGYERAREERLVEFPFELLSTIYCD